MNTMSEKEKMLAGLAYFAGTEELFGERMRAKKLTHRYNLLEPDALQERADILRELLGSYRGEPWIEAPFQCDYGCNIHVGENFYANYNLVVLDCAPVTIGDNVFLAPNVSLFTAGHPVHPETRNTMLEYAAPITIGNNVWIGGGTILNPGVTVGDNVVIGSGSVVVKDLPSNVIAVGNPCRVLREITDEDRLYYFKDRKLEPEQGGK